MVKKINNDESGLISIVVTVIFTSILALLALGFSQLASREYQQSVDQQLNSQAFYAAESGVNEALDNLYEGTSPTTDCAFQRPISPGSTTFITCVDVETRPAQLEYSEVSSNSSTVIGMNGNVDQLTISWQESGGSTEFSNECQKKFTDFSEWTNSVGKQPRTPVITMMIVPTGGFGFSAVGDDFRNQINAKTAKYLLFPNSNTLCPGNSTADALQSSGAGPPRKGAFIDGNCDANRTPRFCSVNITNIQNNGTPGTGLFDAVAGQSFNLRLRSIYGSSNVLITGRNNSGSDIRFNNNQIVIDSTGKASDVVRRIKVNVPAPTNVYTNRVYPEFAVELTDGLCKRFSVSPGASPSSVIEDSTEPICSYR